MHQCISNCAYAYTTNSMSINALFCRCIRSLAFVFIIRYGLVVYAVVLQHIHQTLWLFGSKVFMSLHTPLDVCLSIGQPYSTQPEARILIDQLNFQRTVRCRQNDISIRHQQTFSLDTYYAFTSNLSSISTSACVHIQLLLVVCSPSCCVQVCSAQNRA